MTKNSFVWLAMILGLIRLVPEAAQAFPNPAARLKDHILIVYNIAQSESEPVARYYAEARDIPTERVLGVRAALTEEITRDQFNDQIRDPIDAYIVSKGWIKRAPGRSPFGDQQLPVLATQQNEIWCIVLIYGMPLKVMNDPKISDTKLPNQALNTNASSVDSELALLPYQGLPISGPLPNPYQLVSYDRSFDALDAKHMIMVTRLDGPTSNDARHLVDDALYAEKNRLVGNVYLDSRGLTDEKQGYYQGDRWLRESYKTFAKKGWPVELDAKPEMYAPNLPWTNVAFYAGWYGAEASGPFMREGAPAFSRGAFAYHIHSFSAQTLHSATANWVGPLIAKGAAATMGAVYEPYLDFMPQWDVFTERILNGYTFAEAAYASEPALSWMTVFVGDPLYTPFKTPVEVALKRAPANPGVQRDFLLLQPARVALYEGKTTEALNLAEEGIHNPNASFAAWEGYAEILSDPRLMPPNSSVAAAYEHAMNLSTTVPDQMRTGFKAAQAYQDRFRPQDATRLLTILLTRYPNDAVYYGAEEIYKRIQSAFSAKPPASAAAMNAAPAPESAATPAAQ